MPSLGEKSFRVYPEQRTNDPFVFKSHVSVDRDGIFSFTIPEELEETADANRKLQEPKLCSVGRNRANHLVIIGKTKQDCECFITKVIQDYLACNVTKETIIAYRTEARLSYWKTATGEIVPNGIFDPDYNENGGEWNGSLNGSTQHHHTYSVGLAARCYVKVTAHRNSGDQVSYERTYGDGTHFSRDTYLQKLGQFVGLDFDLAQCKQIPYTEEAAKFFYDAMMSLCKLSDRIEGFFESPETVQKAIESRAGFMLGTGK